MEAAGGILNRGNTCYISAALQLLFRFRPFHEMLLELARCFPDIAFFAALANMSGNIETSVEPLAPDSVIALFQIDPLKQFDVCEFMTTLVNRMLEVSNNVAIAGLVYFRFVEPDHPTNTLFCSIPVFPNSMLANAIANMGESFGEGFTSMPQLMMIQIARMTFDGEKNLLEKDSRPMQISERLKINGQVYYLYGVIEHIGRPDHGHYVAYVRDSKGWLKCNDSVVTTSTLEEVQRTAVDQAYVIAYVRDLGDVRVLSHQQAPRPISRSIGNLHIRLFDASVMRVVESMDVRVSNFDDAIMTVNEVKAGWAQRYGILRVRYKKKRGALAPTFPRNISNLEEEEVLAWIERDDMEEFDPNDADIQRISVRYVVVRPHVEVSLAFHPTTKAKRLIRYGIRFFSVISYGIAASSDLSFYWEFDSRVVLVSEQSLGDTTVRQFQATHGDITIVVSPRNIVPPNAMRMRASIVQTSDGIQEIEELNFLVAYDKTIADVLNTAKETLHVPSVVMYVVKEDGRMERVHYASDYDPLYEVIPANGHVRIEPVPEPNSYNFLLVDTEGHYHGMTFMFSIDADEPIEKLEARVQRYLSLGDVVVRFKPEGSEPFRPLLPYNEVPATPFVVLVSLRD